MNEAVAKGRIVNARQSDDVLLKEAQAIVDGIVDAHPALFAVRPDLYVHTVPDNHEFLQLGGPLNKGRAMFPSIIETPHAFIKTIQTDSGAFRAVMAHELAHIANLDCSPERIAEVFVTGGTFQQERLANRKGALLHGNVRDFYEHMAKMESQRSSPMHPSSSQILSDGEAFLTRLRAGGAVNENSIVIEFDRALEIYGLNKLVDKAINGLKRVASHLRF
jgi:hypothetical protein